MKKLTKANPHKIGTHGAVFGIVRRGNKVIEICLECGKEVRKTKTTYQKIMDWLDTHDQKFKSGWEWRENLNKYLRRILNDKM